MSNKKHSFRSVKWLLCEKIFSNLKLGDFNLSFQSKIFFMLRQIHQWNGKNAQLLMHNIFHYFEEFRWSFLMLVAAKASTIIRAKYSKCWNIFAIGDMLGSFCILLIYVNIMNIKSAVNFQRNIRRRFCIKVKTLSYTSDTLTYIFHDGKLLTRKNFATMRGPVAWDISAGMAWILIWEKYSRLIFMHAQHLHRQE